MLFTLVNDLKDYQYKKLAFDLIAGLTVAVILVPQGMAYALLAGLPPVYGLYAAIVPMLLYPIFASSRQLSVGPVALMSIIILSGVSVFAEPGTPEYLDMVLMTALLSGIIQVISALLGFGKLSKYLSKPVMDGFISAAAVVIAISQLKYLLSLDQARSITVPSMISETFAHIADTNFYSLALGLGGIIFLLLLKKWHKLIPSALLAVILGSIILYTMNLEAKGVPIVGALPEGLPSFYSGFIDWNYLLSLLPASFIISMICFIGSFSIAKSLAHGKNEQSIDAKKELLGLGFAKIVGSFFLAMPSTGSFTRSVINDQAGALTGMASFFAAGFVALTLLFFGHLFYYLPEPILAAIVITSVFSLIDLKEAQFLFKDYKIGFFNFITTFILTLSLGIVNGILLGIGVSLIVSFLSSRININKPHQSK